MQCIIMPSGDPFFNLAADEFLMRNSPGEYFILSINEKSLIIGKHQLSHRETNTRFVTENEIPVIRRISGGGTVFHDPGNLNFSFILNSTEGRQVDFRKYTRPVISFLASLGIDARFEGKSDLKIGGLKISGNAEYVFRNRVLHHGTLLFEADLGFLRNSIRKDTSNYGSGAVPSNPSPVTNLGGILKNVAGIEHFRDLMLEWFLRNYPGAVVSTLSETEKERIAGLAESRYKTWDWNYAFGPPYVFRNLFMFDNRQVTCELSVKDGIIDECLITGHSGLEEACRKLPGCRHMVEDVRQILDKENGFCPGFDIFNLF